MAPVPVADNDEDLWHFQDLTIYLVFSQTFAQFIITFWEGSRGGFYWGEGYKGKSAFRTILPSRWEVKVNRLSSS